MILPGKAERIVQHSIDKNRPAGCGSDPGIVGTKEFITLSVLKKPPFMDAVVLNGLFGNGAAPLAIMIEIPVDNGDLTGAGNGDKRRGHILPPGGK